MKGYTAEAFLSLGSSSSFQGTTESETAQDAKKEIITLTNKGVRCHAVTPLGLSLTHNMSPVLCSWEPCLKMFSCSVHCYSCYAADALMKDCCTPSTLCSHGWTSIPSKLQGRGERYREGEKEGRRGIPWNCTRCRHEESRFKDKERFAANCPFF